MNKHIKSIQQKRTLWKNTTGRILHEDTYLKSLSDHELKQINKFYYNKKWHRVHTSWLHKRLNYKPKIKSKLKTKKKIKRYSLIR